MLTREGDWWGVSLELDAGVGEDLSAFSVGSLNLELRGDTGTTFSIGFQTGNFLRGDQVNNFASFGPEGDYQIQEDWQTFSFPIETINGGANLADVTNVIALMSQNSGRQQDHPTEKHLFQSIALHAKVSPDRQFMSERRRPYALDINPGVANARRLLVSAHDQ